MTRQRRSIICAAIMAELDRRKRTRYWLAKRIGMHPNLVSRALSPDHDMRASTAERMLSALNLSVKP